MRKYKWILDVIITEDYYQYISTLYLDIIIDPYKLQKEKGWPISKLAKILISYTPQGETYSFKASEPIRIYDGPEDEMESLIDELNNLMEMIRQAIDVPPQQRMTNHNRLKIGSWIIPIMPIPDDAIFS